MSAGHSFLMITCQAGAEPALKNELARLRPEFRFSYSRPGFVTFKLPPDLHLGEDFDLRSVFARAAALSLGRVSGADDAERAQAAWKLAEGRTYEQLHVWPRDAATPGHHGYQPGFTPESAAVEEALRAAAPSELLVGAHPRPPATPGQRVLDCVVVGPNEWWIGYHRARSRHSRLPGGLRRLRRPGDSASRAYLKMEEALRWARLPLAAGDRCAELGCAPGGSAQALLERGMEVIGVDPAAVAEDVAKHPRFHHVRRRAAQVPRKAFAGVRWLFSDMNVAPNFTLDAVEPIVTDRRIRIRGLLLTLKLPEWKLADEIPAYLQRVRGWGFPYLRARQLQYNRQEFCVVALRRRPRPRRAEAADD